MVINFGAGPAKLPEEVLLEVQRDLIQHGQSGISVMEMSHRSKEYADIHLKALQSVRDILNVPDNYKVLFMQGGGTGIFSAICMNLMGKTGVADYCVTGTWSTLAAKEAAKYGKVNMVFPKPAKFTTVPDQSTWKLDPNASYVYYCDNETVNGVEFPFIPETNGVTLVADMSSNMLSRPFDITKFGLIFGGAQKNIGPAGITVVVVREDLIGNAMPTTPTILDFKATADNNSLYNTPPTFTIYVMGLVFEWIKKKGGLEAMNANALTKSQLIYKAIENSNGFYTCPVDLKYRSRMNVPFRAGSATGDEALEAEFLKGAEKLAMVQLKGHRSVGGIRASLYNAVSVENAQVLAKYMADFHNSHKTN